MFVSILLLGLKRLSFSVSTFLPFYSLLVSVLEIRLIVIAVKLLFNSNPRIPLLSLECFVESCRTFAEQDGPHQRTPFLIFQTICIVIIKIRINSSSCPTFVVQRACTFGGPAR